MADPKSPIYSRNQDRRSAFNRRWIKSDYKGEERRSGKDRREEKPIVEGLPVPDDYDTEKSSGLARLLVTNAVQLEALTRLLLDKGLVSEDELLEMMHKVQAEYQGQK